MPDPASPWPDYACAIVLSPDGSIWFEDRPPTARHAAGMLTCFGGRRETGESPVDCLRRELREELDWEPEVLQKMVELWVAQQPMAWFYLASPAVTAGDLNPRVAPARLVSRHHLAQQPVSPWHRAVLDAWQQGVPRVDWNSPGHPVSSPP
ncbi:MAG TPA: hypothetical protein DDY91_13405 [Planctomycetaceae bacterium]|jgi:8-oxo-dGTP pyrophosphatase MutT (NUDIX family)|nr:hypothetical protein [Planctomycetaceae bacterium]